MSSPRPAGETRCKMGAPCTREAGTPHFPLRAELRGKNRVAADSGRRGAEEGRAPVGAPLPRAPSLLVGAEKIGELYWTRGRWGDSVGDSRFATLQTQQPPSARARATGASRPTPGPPWPWLGGDSRYARRLLGFYRAKIRKFVANTTVADAEQDSLEQNRRIPAAGGQPGTPGISRMVKPGPRSGKEARKRSWLPGVRLSSSTKIWRRRACDGSHDGQRGRGLVRCAEKRVSKTRSKWHG